MLRLRSVRQSCGSDFSPAIQSHQDHHTLARDCLFAKNSTSLRMVFLFVFIVIGVVVVVSTLGNGIPSPPLLLCLSCPFGIEGSHPFACIRRQARSFGSVAGGRCRSPPLSSSKHAPPPLEVLLPHSPPSLDARQTRGLCAPGAQLPASSVRGIGARRGDGTVTLVGWGVALLVALPP